MAGDRVVFLILDGLPLRHVGPHLTPALWALATASQHSFNPTGGLSVMASSTYSNHRTFITGRAPVDHGVAVNRPIIDGAPVQAEHVPHRVPTLFDACRAAQRSSIAVLGDHHLVGVMGAAAADRHFPFGGTLPDGARTDPYGYLDDSVTIEHLIAAIDESPDLVVAQLNRPDTYGHLHGPDTAEAHAQYRATDADVARVVDSLASQWSDTVLIVVSDHDQEMISVETPFDLAAAAVASGIDAAVSMDGTAAMVAAAPTAVADTQRWLAGHAASARSGVAGYEQLDGTSWIAWAHPGGWFAPERYAGAMVGVHGGAHTRTQLAIVAGGSPAATRLGASFTQRRPGAADWAPEIAELLGADLGAAPRAAE